MNLLSTLASPNSKWSATKKKSSISTWLKISSGLPSTLASLLVNQVRRIHTTMSLRERITKSASVMEASTPSSTRVQMQSTSRMCTMRVLCANFSRELMETNGDSEMASLHLTVMSSLLCTSYSMVIGLRLTLVTTSQTIAKLRTNLSASSWSSPKPQPSTSSALQP